MILLNHVANLFLTLVPALSNYSENWAQLEEFTFAVAKMAAESLRLGRATLLFEATVHTVTRLCNVMSIDVFNNCHGINFCSWVGETLLTELEKVGACGGLDASVLVAASN
ncbi:hypothetical protein HJC23_007307 [Cyclotella cryptica]|uniref:Uncharacterized protein n=1 Tax=Cyclotella cryptica TaxID=29204 RepID=A0ABD3P0F6_9STRA|eukprot:CCRYP_018325-RA/>CCRYP_018325-RA protein AED:0.47 eAED:0.47 QI:0/0/0/1/0/0/2/0/110